MTRDEYEDARDFMARNGVTCPAPGDLVPEASSAPPRLSMGAHPVIVLVHGAGRAVAARHEADSASNPVSRRAWLFRVGGNRGADLPAKWMLPGRPITRPRL